MSDSEEKETTTTAPPVAKTSSMTPVKLKRTASWKQLVPSFLLGVTLCMFTGMVALMKERPVTGGELLPTEYASVPLDQWPTQGHAYNIVDFQTPAASGVKLKLLSYLIAKSPLSPWLLRYLLDRNKVYLIRELVASSPTIQKLPPKHFPVHHASPQEMATAREWYDANAKQTLQRGSTYEISRVNAYDPAPGYRTIREYHRLYRLKRAKPSQVMERLIGGVEHDLAHLRIF